MAIIQLAILLKVIAHLVYIFMDLGNIGSKPMILRLNTQFNPLKKMKNRGVE
jgi:hypothetical protein